nr:3-hydroxyisobutyrate dehydrogenase [Mesobacterium pallidum]
MSDISIRKVGRIGRITLTRPQALNALSYDMCLQIEQALDGWLHDDGVETVLLDAEGDRAFCSGGDVAKLFHTGRAGDTGYAEQFWRDEYRLNAKIADYPKPFLSFIQGFCMGGGVGLGCHSSHRIVCESTQIAMPECGIGLIPDVGGTHVLAQAPGHLGEYLGLTGKRMGPGAAMFAGFADLFVPHALWPKLIEAIEKTGDFSLVVRNAKTPPANSLGAVMDEVNQHFSKGSLAEIFASLAASDTHFADETTKALTRNSPLSMACTLEAIRRLRGPDLTIRRALEMEFRFTSRAMAHSDFLEGVRATLIDKDRNPTWMHRINNVPAEDVEKMLAPLGERKLSFVEDGLKIAFIGLGNMGGPMAANLANAGYAVTGFDTQNVSIDGVTPAASAAEAAKGADVVITMLPNGQILRAVAGEVIPAMQKGAVLLDCSTVDVDSARAVADQAKAAGLLSLDAPVSGGVGGATGGTLTFMVGGSKPAFAKARPLFEIMGQKAVHCGEAGAGQSAKICNNMILGVTMIATCEAFALADKLGLSREAMFDVVSTSSGYSWSMNAYCPAPGVGPESPADRDYKPGFASELMLKDLGLSQMAAEAVDADTPMGQAALDLYRRFVEDEDGKGKDFSAMLPRFEKRGRG